MGLNMYKYVLPLGNFNVTDDMAHGFYVAIKTLCK